MTRTELTAQHALLAAMADLVEQRAARPGARRAPTVTVCVKEAATLFADATPDMQQLIRAIAQHGRSNGVRLMTRRRIAGRQYGTATELNAAVERGEA
ncbi:hypothetical protein [Streptomyces sp. NPDC056308]|uniref:hypothetical protein n=1 Tax=Streptomyces sp. NPDC056308 TaxID=3345780 RepID=UPI0035D5B919